MKKIFLLAISISLFSCEEEKPFKNHKKKFLVQMSNDKGWSGSDLECDSFNMVNKHEVVVWIDKNKSTIHADEIRIFTNTNF